MLYVAQAVDKERTTPSINSHVPLGKICVTLMNMVLESSRSAELDKPRSKW